VAKRAGRQVLGAKRKERQAIERERHGKTYEEMNWAKLSPAFREAHNWLRILQGEPPLPPPAIDLYVPPKAAEKIKQLDPIDPEFLQRAQEFIGPLPNEPEDTRWDTWDDVPDEFLEWARANACGHDVLKAAKKRTKNLLRRRKIIREELFALIRKINDAYMADPDPRAQPKTKAAAVEQVVKGLHREPDDPAKLTPDEWDKWIEHKELIRRTAYRALEEPDELDLANAALRSSRQSRGKAFDNRVEPPSDERGAREWFETMQFSRRMRRERRRTRR
jgi:hypothetical protein